MNLDIIKSTISNQDVKVISFDIFDTLIERPVLNPTDIFILINDQVKTIVGNNSFNFYKIRRNIESEVRDIVYCNTGLEKEVTFQQIYDYFQKQFDLTGEQIRKISQLEIELERRLLTARNTGRQLYDFAVMTGKRIICISDMYHEPAFILDVMAKNGYNQIDNIYVSSKEKKRKDTGQLYDSVLIKESIEPHQLIHIGDNYESDFRIPLNKGIIAHHLPSSRDIFFHTKKTNKHLWEVFNNYSPFERIVIGFFINKWVDQLANTKIFFPKKYHLGYFGLGIVLFSLTQYLISNKDIQKNYPEILFASRDGFLPMKAYDFLNQYSSKSYIKSRYIYCGRMLYSIANYQRKKVAEYIIKYIINTKIKEDMNLEVLFHVTCNHNFLNDVETRRQIKVGDDKKIKFKNILDIISERKNEIESQLNRKKDNVIKYYSSEIKLSSKGRALIFDCGYNGSVSHNIMKLIGSKIDKVYLWETSQNRKYDKHNKTKTYLMISDILKQKKFGIWLIFEELFSSPEESCIDIEINGKFNPVFDHYYSINKKTKEDLLIFQKAAMNFVKDIRSLLGDYIDEVFIHDISFSLEPIESALISPTDLSIKHLDDIIFPDVFTGEFRPLSEKIEPENSEHLLRTNFINSDIAVSKPKIKEILNCNVAIHIHLYYISQARSFIERLKTVTIPFDLFISVCSDKNKNITAVIFNKLVIPKLNQLNIKVVPNRGRDVAPWIVEFGATLKNYEYVCHVHTKKSLQFDWGDEWRNYLLNNLITGESMLDIISHFEHNPNIGLIFPPMYKNVFSLWTYNNLTPIEMKDRINCDELLRKMGINEFITKNRLLFSAGTMFWYRSKALSPLFDLNLDYKDFPEEPIEHTGTISHAIERIPSIIANHKGYMTKSYIKQDILVEDFYDNLIYSMGYNLNNSIVTNPKKYLLILKAYVLKKCPPGTQTYKILKSIKNNINKYIDF